MRHWLDYLVGNTQAFSDFLLYLQEERQRILQIDAKDWDHYNKLRGAKEALDNLMRFATMADNDKVQENYYLESVTGAK